jgi:inhibitor of cysteine peptidase
MEYNMRENNEQEPTIIREETGSSHTLWYWILAALLIILFGWYGYTADWFSQRSPDLGDLTTTIEQDNGIDQGEPLLNAAPIDTISINTLESFPVQQVLVVSGQLPDGCTYLNDPIQTRDGNVFNIELTTYRQGELCTQALVPYEKIIPLEVNNLPAGVYIVDINGREISFELETDNLLDFNAGEGK